MRPAAALAFATLLLLGPAGAQEPLPDPGLGEAWQRALRDPLVALPQERANDAEAALARLDRLAKAFADSQEMLSGTGSGPMLEDVAPDAASLRGVGADRAAVTRFLAAAAEFRAGRLGPDAHAAASLDLVQVGNFLERTRAPAQRYAAVASAWQEAQAWYERLTPMAAPVTGGGPTVVAGNATPGGTVRFTVQGGEGNGTLQTPWGNQTVGPGTSEGGIGVPSNQTPGTYTGTLVVGGRPVANVTIVVDLIPLTLDVLGPRHAEPGSSAAYRIGMTSPVLVTRPGRFNVTADGVPVPVEGDAFTLAFPAQGEVQVHVAGGPGHPWASASRTFTVQVVAAAPPAGTGLADLAPVLVAGPLVLLLAIAAALRARRPAQPVPAGATPLSPAWGLASRLRAWWSSPAAVVASDYRRAARILGEAGRLDASATHGRVAEMLRAEGIPAKRAERLAWAYEQVAYAGDAGQAGEYWSARKGAP